MDEKILSLVINYCQNTINEIDFKQLKAWVERDSDNKKVFNEYVRLYKRSKQLELHGEIHEKDAWERVTKSVNRPVVKNKMIYRIVRYAASVIILMAIGISVYFITNDNSSIDRKEALMVIKPGNSRAVLTLSDGSNMILPIKKQQLLAEHNGSTININNENVIEYKPSAKKSDKILFNTIKVPRAGEYSLKLADGTMVWINSDSELRYPVEFTGKERRVYLKGEAFFSVSKNKEKAFIVETYGTKVKVLGTRFNVSSYGGKEEIVTTLAEGSVVIKDCNNCIAKIQPGQQAISGMNYSDVKVQEVDVDLYTLWVDGIFKYENKPFGDIAEQLSRWYDVDFIFENEEIKNVRFAGAVNKHKPIYFALFMIEQLSDLKFELINNRRIRVYKRK
jgi:ferric-dicitrate binding protein FerR (iron transport regulator)